LRRTICENILSQLHARVRDRGSTVVKVLCYNSIFDMHYKYMGTAVAQWLRCCATI